MKFGKYIVEESQKGTSDFTLDTIFRDKTDKLVIIKNHLLDLEEEKNNNLKVDELKSVE